MLALLLPIAEAGSLTLAVAPFVDATGQHELAALGRGLADMVLTDLCADPTLTCVERSQLTALLAEIELGASGFTTPETAQRLGQGVGATHFVLGTLTASSDTLRLDGRLVEVSTGRVLETVSRAGPRDDAFALEAALVQALAPALAVRAPERNPASTASIVAYGRALGAEEDGRVGVARSLLAAAVDRDPGMVWASSRLATLSARVDEARGATDARLAEIVALVDGIAGGDTAACVGLQQRVWGLVQPITMGGRFVTLDAGFVLPRWKEAGLTEPPADLPAMALGVGRRLYEAHAVARLVLDRGLADGLCPGSNPNEVVLGGVITALGAARESAGREVQVAMIAADGTVARSPEALDDLLLDYAELYVTRFPTGALHGLLPHWLEPAVARVEARSVRP